MLKKCFSIFLVFLLISTHFGAAVSANEPAAENETTNLYLIGGDEERTLSTEKGNASTPDVVQQNEKLTYVIEDVTAEYNGTGTVVTDLFLNGLGVGVGNNASVSFDFNGDGTWDLTHEAGQMNTDGVEESESYERFTRDLPADGYENLESGKVKVEVWPMFGPEALEVKVNAPEDASKIILPYSFEASGEEPEPTEPSDSIQVGDVVPINNDDWRLTWHDEFEGDELNTDNWRIDIGNGFYDGSGQFIHGWGNEELQYYQEDNVWVEDGHLVLEGRQETVHVPGHGAETFNYTSGKVLSDGGRFNQKYGRFEAKMALPEGQGYWPAFWMMPEDDVYGGWAASGEIDIMENAGATPGHIGGAIHYGGQWPNNTYTAKDYHFPEGRDATDFNVYAVEWEPGEIRWYVNDELYQTLNNWSTTGSGNAAKYAYPAPFDQEFHIILNLAIGGWYGGNPDSSTEFPGQVLVDYVRVYELTGREYREPVEPAFEAVELPENAKHPVDGNWIYDTNYENGFTDIKTDAQQASDWDYDNWNFVHLEQFNGNGSVSVDNVNGQPFAKVDIANGGNQTHSIQLIQNVTMGTGRWYKLSFDAKSSTNRNMSVKIGGGPDRGWTAYSPSETYALTNEVQTYEMVFQMQHDTDPHARLELNMGTNANPVWIGNVVVEEVDAEDPYNEDDPKRPLRNGNHVYNGTFDQGRMDRMTFWHVLTDGATATASVDEAARELAVSIEDGGSEADAIKVLQRGINLLQNDEYKLTFDARATEARDIEVALLSKDGDVNYSETETISLSTAMEQKEMTFTMSSPADIESQLVFMLGGNDSNVVIDNVRLVRLTDNNASISLEDAFPLKNGDFSNDFNNWSQHVQGDHEPGVSSGSFEVVDGQLKASVTNAGWEPWHVLFSQDGLSLKEFNTYIVEFDARSTVDRNIEVVAENSSYHRYFSDVVALTDEMQTFSFEFTMDTDDSVDLKFLLGNVDVGSHDIFFDNVKLEVKGEREKYFPLVNGDFSNGLDNWHDHVQGVYDGPSAATFVEEAGEAKATVEHTGTNPWDISLSQEGLTLHEGFTYVVEFDARSSIDRALEVVIDNGEAGGYFRHFEDVVQLTNETQTFKYEFDMPTTDVIGLKFLIGAVESVIEDSHDIFIDNVRLEVKGAREVLEGGDDQDPVDPGEPGDGEDPADPSDKEWREIGENLVVDGTFDETTEFGNPDNLLTWNTFNLADHDPNGGLAEFSVNNGVLNAEVRQVGWDWWQIQLFQNIDVPAGTYKMAFDMQSEIERIVRVELAGTGIQEFTVGNTMETYEVIIEVTESGEFQLLFGLGREGTDEVLAVPYTIVIDNVRLVEVEEIDGTDPGEPGDGTDPDPVDPKDPEPVEVESGVETSVSANQVVKLQGTNASIKMPDNLPEGATISIELVEEPAPNANHTKAGQVIKVNLQGAEDAVGFELELSYDEGYEEVAIFYYNETTEEWEFVGGEMNTETNTISVTVDHFSTYGVFASESGDGQDPDPGEPGDGQDPDPVDPGEPGDGQDPDPVDPGEPGDGEDPDPTDPSDPGDSEELQQRINELMELIEQLNTRISELENNNEILELEMRVAQLEGQLNALKAQFSDIEEYVAQLEMLINDLKEELAALKAQFADFETPEAPKTDDDSSEEDGTDGDVDSEESSKEDSSKDGDELPNTATNLFNYLVIGMLLLIIGAVTFFTRKKHVFNN
ncbi:carbohydrate binding domain-containing protein [Evansella cellulosilytica]|uniref:LPXTG-motif cell wall anchor domain protein n=1 Tax=Evansella cellulosilytica (strain ATCC 21833 / DSM 2522 / FERM P-1141 / JCM 9156 / N-4) TaxID=649639 RepID=E6TZA3_EVAC2|nr:carbohydrate binding domain-containing protein [Evansella cellulosilytica]ADU28965.1 LPXTG-motif cell wall anchor domain protein [Evansella cellulosilytica DSM 2522]